MKRLALLFLFCFSFHELHSQKAALFLGVPDGSKEEHLFSAIQANNAEGVKSALEEKANLHAKIQINQIGGITPLLFAAAGENGDIIRLLVTSGANVNAVTSRGDSVLIFAVARHSPDTIQYLLSRGAKVNHQNMKGSTPLLEASKGYQPEIVDLLIKGGANVNAALNQRVKIVNRDFRDFIAGKGTTPLMVAAMYQQFKNAELLLKARAKVNAQEQENDKWTALKIARHLGDQRMIDLLIRYGAK